ncbi:ATP-binding protein [Streptomyces phaeochromogenes]|uniref:AlbA family DNA-binding domain-containing protein n=1 Tax=Streptomyces phaeochromogenes TaxID=1923 RepID=UPI003864C7E1|nr:ATP-binding protein [Streptomyces phaeochromogenes]
MAFRSRRLEELFGGALDTVSYAEVVDLIGKQEAAEAEDLDYKQQHYSADPKSREELAKDVASFANHLGGVIVIGMAESRGVPSRAFDVDLGDQHLRDLQQRIASTTAPPIRWEPLRKENSATPGHGLLLIAIPPSPQAPHAITVTPTKPSTTTLRYPRRAGTKTDWLSETYVASAYHQRFTAAADRRQRMRDIEQDLVTAECERDKPHLLVTLVPDTPGRMRINQESFTDHKQALQAAQPLLGLGKRVFQQVSVGAHKLVLDSPRARSRSDLVQLYDDGSGIWAQPIETWVDRDEDVDERVRFVEAGLLVHRLMSALAFLAGHARDRCGTTGTAAIEVHLVDEMYSHPYTPPEPVGGRTPRERAYPMNVASPAPFPQGTRTAVYAQANVTALIDDLADARLGLVQASSPLADQIFHTFGIPEAHPLTQAGEIRASAWHIELRDAITSWAHTRGIPVA